MSDAAAIKEPVKSVVEYRVRPGREAEFEGWIRRVIEAAGRQPGLEGSSVLTGGGSHFLLLRFARAEDLAAWEASSARADLCSEGEMLMTPTGHQVRQGLATWFTLPEHRTSADPPRWKMAIVTWCALFPQIVLLGFALQPFPLPSLANQALSSMICVASLTWFVMPFLARRLRPWLVRGANGARA